MALHFLSVASLSAGAGIREKVHEVSNASWRVETVDKSVTSSVTGDPFVDVEHLGVVMTRATVRWDLGEPSGGHYQDHVAGALPTALQ